MSESRSYNAADQVVGWTYDALDRLPTTTTGSEQRNYTYNEDGRWLKFREQAFRVHRFVTSGAPE